MELSQSDRPYTADELASLAGIPRRTLRYYIQLGLVDRPIGETRGAYYTGQHLSQLLEIRKLTEQGFALERVREEHERERRSRRRRCTPRPGGITVKSHIHLADGIELVVEPTEARLAPRSCAIRARGVSRLRTRHLRNEHRHERQGAVTMVLPAHASSATDDLTALKSVAGIRYR
jgi:DNA-binding transcriptional MerR regulator